MREENKRQQERRKNSRVQEHRVQETPRQLTPEERRRRQILKKQRARQRRRARIRRFLLVAVILILLVVVLPKGIRWGYDITIGAYHKIDALFDKDGGQDSGKDSVQTGGTAGDHKGPAQMFTFGSVEQEVMTILQNRYQGDEDGKAILDHSRRYPDELLTLLSKRPETLDFVLQYPEYKDLPEPQVEFGREIKKGTVPLLYQWDIRWGYGRYGDNIMALAGCGPTCLSMVMLGLTGDVKWDPIEIARFSEMEGYVSQVGTSWELMNVGAEKLGIVSQELPLDENRMIRELKEGHPIICSMRPGDFTDTGHFIVLVDYEKDGFIVHDPNSIDNSKKIWNYEEIRGQIRNLWAFSLPQ